MILTSLAVLLVAMTLLVVPTLAVIAPTWAAGITLAALAVTALAVLTGTRTRASPAPAYPVSDNGYAIQVLSTEMATAPAVYCDRSRASPAGTATGTTT